MMHMDVVSMIFIVFDCTGNTFHSASTCKGKCAAVVATDVKLGNK